MFPLAAIAAMSISANASGAQKVWFVILERTKTVITPDRAKQEEMQNAHIGNFKRLYGLKKLIAAGPLEDKGGNKRGIVVLTVDKRKDVDECFLPDPYVQGDIMIPHAIPMKIEFGGFDTTIPDPQGVEENRIVLFTGPAQNGTAHAEYVRKTAADAHIAFFAETQGKEEIRAIAIIKGADDGALKSWIDADPAVTAGLKATVMPQWLSKGVLK